MNTKKARQDMPHYTCGDIDQIIAMLESLRKDNARLRQVAEDALDFADEETERANKAEARLAEIEG